MTDRQAAYSTHDFKWILKYASVYFAQVKDWHLHTIYNFKYPIAFKYMSYNLGLQMDLHI